MTTTQQPAAGAPQVAGVEQITKQRADSSRTIRLEQRTRPMAEVNMHTALVDQPGCRGAVNMDLTPFLDGPEHLADIAARAIAHGGSQVRIGEAGPGSLHTGHEVGLTYDVLTRSAVAEALPELIFLHDNAATAVLRQATKCDDLVPLPGERGINVNITSGGHVHEWHVGGPDLLYTSSTGIQVPAPGRGLDPQQVVYVDDHGLPQGVSCGEGRYLPFDGSGTRTVDMQGLAAEEAVAKLSRPVEHLRDAFGCLRVDPTTPGAFVWHDGARKHATLIEDGRTLVAPGYTPHGVNGVPPEFVRITLIMSWVHAEDAAQAAAGGGRYVAEGQGGERELADYLYGQDGHTGALKAGGGQVAGLEVTDGRTDGREVRKQV